MTDISILIPARSEMFLARTIQDILEHSEADTEIIAVLDGSGWAEPQLEDHDRVKIIYYAESIGQRAATNTAARLSNAKYIIKCDAHCSFDQGFDRKMLEAFKKAGDNVTMVPIMRNLWVFDWKCHHCGWKKYQGLMPEKCEDCGKTDKIERKMVWIGKRSPQSVSYCFDSEPHFQYFKEYAKTDEYKKMLKETGITETMSLQGSFFMTTREKYWELELGNEEWGSWGSQGLQIACSTWLSGGRVLVNHNTWYAHCFRTGKGFGFPYPQSGRAIQRAKKHAKKLLHENKFPKQILPSSWLLDKFWPIRGWKDDERALITKAGEEFYKERESDYVAPESPEKGIIYFTDNQLKIKIAHAVQDQLRSIGLPIVSCSLKPMPHFGKNIHLNLERGYLSMFKQILAALEASDAKYIFFTEHDCLYPRSHFDFIPPTKDKFYYNVNWWRVRFDDGFSVSWEANQVSGLCADRELLLEHYRKRVAMVEKYGYKSKMGFEPGSHNNPDEHGYRDRKSISKEVYIDDVMYGQWKSKEPIVDIKHGKNLSKNKWSLDDFRDKKTAKNFRTGKCPEWARGMLGYK